MIERKEVTIGDTEFSLEQMSATRSTRVLLRITRAMAEPFARFMSTADADTLDKFLSSNVGLARIGEALGMLAENLTDDDFDYVITCLFKGMTINGKLYDGIGKPLHESTFRGKQKAMLTLVWEALRFNYADFFGESA